MKERNLTPPLKPHSHTSRCDRAMVQMVPRREKVKAGCGVGWRKTFKGCLELPDRSAIFCVSYFCNTEDGLYRRSIKPRGTSQTEEVATLLEPCLAKIQRF